MTRFAFPTPVLPGKHATDVPKVFAGRLDEYEESRRRQGVSAECAYEMATPMGTFVIAYIEAEGSMEQVMGAMGASDLPIDRDFRAALADVHGMDPAAAPPGPPPEELGHYRDPDVKDRRRGLGFVAPIMPGTADRARAFAREALGARLAEHTASRRALGICQESIFLCSSPAGELICVYLEGDDPAEGNRRFAASQSEYDRWFKDQCHAIFPPQVDFDEPVPPVVAIWEWRRAAVTA
jgi:catechol 2,3-dioxygenase-like lactoylglutathione lyase family enzyme